MKHKGDILGIGAHPQVLQGCLGKHQAPFEAVGQLPLHTAIPPHAGTPRRHRQHPCLGHGHHPGPRRDDGCGRGPRPRLQWRGGVPTEGGGDAPQHRLQLCDALVHHPLLFDHRCRRGVASVQVAQVHQQLPTVPLRPQAQSVPELQPQRCGDGGPGARQGPGELGAAEGAVDLDAAAQALPTWQHAGARLLPGDAQVIHHVAGQLAGPLDAVRDLPSKAFVRHHPAAGLQHYRRRICHLPRCQGADVQLQGPRGELSPEAHEAAVFQARHLSDVVPLHLDGAGAVAGDRHPPRVDQPVGQHEVHLLLLVQAPVVHGILQQMQLPPLAQRQLPLQCPIRAAPTQGPPQGPPLRPIPFPRCWLPQRRLRGMHRCRRHC
mmetsp:Transcript_18404/g.55436  ORF Transcript_18404/g.55436 Transcript_18404/m.55436 type:complete len:377 (+) Transcript_18404:4405-5535(+)